ncbi:hypothetical protein [Shimia sediminis]|uniref:hypothetical protein n=1 Tax=Shimia sediminis TaxID=2497945 RepID=UPI000F8D9A66|nr:hypothetical protein [Shimia sediminis]
MTGCSTGLARPLHLWASGFARRWHMNAALSGADDFNCAHQGRCAMLVIVLFPDHSLTLLRAAVTHDAAEFVVGDLSQPFKAVGGGLVADHASLEGDVLTRMGLACDLSEFEQRCLKLIDRIDAVLFVQLRAPQEARRNGWPEVQDWCLGEAAQLGCGEAVAGLFWDSECRAYEGGAL